MTASSGRVDPNRSSEPEFWIVTADGDTIGTFDNQDDAESMAAVWNHAYPHEPWFKVSRLRVPQLVAELRVARHQLDEARALADFVMNEMATYDDGGKYALIPFADLQRLTDLAEVAEAALSSVPDPQEGT